MIPRNSNLNEDLGRVSCFLFLSFLIVFFLFFFFFSFFSSFFLFFLSPSVLIFSLFLTLALSCVLG